MKNLKKFNKVNRAIKEKISRIAHKHSYEKISWHEEYDPVHNLRYSMRTYRCAKCGKTIEVDGRYDTICA